MDKLMTFKHTNEGMMTVENRRGYFLLKNEVLGVLHEMIAGKERVLAEYSNEDDPRKEDDWFKKSKAKYEGQLEVLEEIKRMLY